MDIEEDKVIGEEVTGSLVAEETVEARAGVMGEAEAEDIMSRESV